MRPYILQTMVWPAKASIVIAIRAKPRHQIIEQQPNEQLDENGIQHLCTNGNSDAVGYKKIVRGRYVEEQLYSFGVHQLILPVLQEKGTQLFLPHKKTSQLWSDGICRRQQKVELTIKMKTKY